MEKFLVTIEFRYSDKPKGEYDCSFKGKTITIGVYDDFDEACVNSNKLLEKLESRFTIHTFPDGSEAKRGRLSKNGGCFGGKNILVTNLAYLRTPFEFYVKIQTLHYLDVEETISEVLEAGKRYKEYKIKENED